jgi:Zn-dependent alcohol dehydrogenase
LLQHAYNQEANEKAALFKIIADLADEASLPELISRIEGKDSAARMHIISILSRFNRPEVSAAIQTQLRDPNKLVRQAALNALSKMDGPITIAPAALFTLTEKKVIGCALGSCNALRDIPRLLNLYRAGRLDLDALITSRRPLAEINQAMDDLRAARGVRTVLSCS